MNWQNGFLVASFEANIQSSYQPIPLKVYRTRSLKNICNIMHYGMGIKKYLYFLSGSRNVSFLKNLHTLLSPTKIKFTLLYLGLNSDELKDSHRFVLMQINSILRLTLHLNFQLNSSPEFSRRGGGSLIQMNSIIAPGCLNSDELKDGPKFALIEINSILRLTLHLNFQPNPLNFPGRGLS